MASTDLDESLRPSESFNPPKSWHQKRITWIAVGTVVIFIGVWLIVFPPWHTNRVTDGSELFLDNLGDVQRMILEENDLVTGSGRPYVSIAFMMPIRIGEDEPNTPESIQHELEGAYLAQYWANHEGAADGQFSSHSPLIRLLIADTGGLGTAWPDTVAQLVSRIEGDEHLVAVAGLGYSVATTQAAVNELSRHNITMFGALITSARLSAPNLARVSPTNADEAGAMIQYLQTTPEWQSATKERPFVAYLIQDTNPADSYAADLGEAYRTAFPKDDPARVLLPKQGGFDASAPAAGNALASEVNTICALNPDVVFFVGRSDSVQTFLSRLAARACAAKNGPITLVTGDDIEELINVRNLWAGDGLTVLFTGLASPQSWKSSSVLDRKTISPTTIAHFVGGPHTYQDLFTGDLKDGHAIMAHDAMITAIEATRRVSTRDAPRPEPAALINGLHQLTAQAPVPGASGWIYFQHANDSSQWLSHNKAVPVLELDSDGTVSLIQLSSREGLLHGPPGSTSVR